MACLLNFAKQDTFVAELWRRGGLSDQNVKMCSIIRNQNLSFWESTIKIHRYSLMLMHDNAISMFIRT